MRARFVKVLAIAMVALQAVVLVPGAAAVSTTLDGSTPADCPGHAGEPGNGCECCPDGVSESECFADCAVPSAMVSERPIEADRPLLTASTPLATAARTRTDAPPNPPPIR